jgi:hypothetical protein
MSPFLLPAFLLAAAASLCQNTFAYFDEASFYGTEPKRFA